MYRMAAYCRLSRDDGENKLSESIENQLKLIREYVEKAEDLELSEVYTDDGYSGMYFDNRPGFQEMLEDIYRGKIQGVITKDISRLGREHIETSNYIERVFPALRVRFIAILDGVDSISHQNEELAQFKTLFNDMYCRDISRKIRGSLETQKRRGDFMAGFAPYGYRKDPEDKHHFLVDEEAAEVVRRIFRLYLAGYAKGSIAKLLNAEKILTPSEYKRNVQGLNYSNAREKRGAKGWSYPTVNAILKNRVYTGDMVQHKTEKISYKIDKYRYIPPDQQILVEHTHEAVIDRDTFKRVQELSEKRTRTPGFAGSPVRVNPYAGLLVCKDCGHSLLRVSARDGYDCAAYHRKGNGICRTHFIPKSVLDGAVMQELVRQAESAVSEKDREEILKADDPKKESDRERMAAGKKLKHLKEQLASVQKYRKKTYENYMEHLLSREEYLSYKKDYEGKEQELQEQIQQIQQTEKERAKEELKNGIAGGKICESWITKLVKYGVLEEAPREALVELIDQIVVNGDKSIDIMFRYQLPHGRKGPEVIP